MISTLIWPSVREKNEINQYNKYIIAVETYAGRMLLDLFGGILEVEQH